MMGAAPSSGSSSVCQPAEVGLGGGVVGGGGTSSVVDEPIQGDMHHRSTEGRATPWLRSMSALER
eukprot:scaffold190290_cov31-Tisochrysis_lutea.AAC.1